VLLTGGEPLLQPELPELARELLAAGHEVMVETGGHRDITVLPEDTIVILDIKTPGSGEHERNLWSNLRRLGPRDAVKLVITSRADYDWAKEVLERHRLAARTTILLSPSFGQVEPSALVAWMLEDRLPARLNLQVHKYVWPPETRGV
jgi:7-carboxy-7-deazaguanine synthase